MSEHQMRSPAAVCLNKMQTYVLLNTRKDLVIYDEEHAEAMVTVEHRAWECPFCGNSTEYWMVNGLVVKGCGMSTLYSNGKISDCCGDVECENKQKQFHNDDYE